MSVDAQPRKRKDKRKNKKDEKSDSPGSHGPGDVPVFVGKPPTPQSSPDEMMHLHKESLVGGSTCTKIIFFLLMSGLVTSIALCIIQYRDPPQIIEDDNIVEEPVNVESSWSIGEWFEPPSFIFGSESKEDHGDSHSGEIVDVEEQHEDEHDDHDELDEHSHDEKEDSGGFFSSLFGGWGESTVEEEPHSEEEEGHDEGDDDVEDSRENEEMPESDEQEDDENEEETNNLSEEKEPDEEDLSTENVNEGTELEEDDLSEELDFAQVKNDYFKDSIKFNVNEDDEDDDKYADQDEEDDADQNDETEDNADQNDETEDNADQNEESEIYQDKVGNHIVNDDDDDDEIPFGKDDLDVDEDNNNSDEVEEFVPASHNVNSNNNIDNKNDDVEEDDDIEETVTVKNERERHQENPVKPKYELKDDEMEDSGEELFPEALEALKMEEALSSHQSSNKIEEEEKADVETDDFLDDTVDDTLPDVSEEEAQGMTVKLVVGIALVVVAHIVLVRKWNSMERERLAAQEFQETVPPVRQQPSESVVKREAIKKQEAPLSGSKPVPSQEPKREAPTPVKQTFIPAPIPVPIPPPSLTPEPSDDEQLSDQDVRNYSEGEEEELVDEEEEEEMLDEEEEIQDESIGKEQSDVEGSPEPSDGEAVAEESEPEIEEEEEVEEEESEDEPPVAVKKMPVRDEPLQKDPPRSRQGRTGPQDIESDIAYDYDWNIKEELDLADEQFNRHPDRCESVYTELVKSHPKSGRAIVGLAKCLDFLAERTRSNPMLERAINFYLQALRYQKLNAKLFLETANRAVNRLRFRGRMGAAVEVHNMLISKHPDNSSFRNDLAINYLMLNKLDEAGKVLKEVINKWPEDSVALAHYGLVLKLKGKTEESIPYLEAGLLKDVEGTRDARLYFHLGDALSRTGKQDKAEEVYEKGVIKGFFRSKYQRSLYNVNRLTPRPWWTHKETTYQNFLKKLEDNWQIIKEEGMAAVRLKKGFLDEAENLRDKGDWKQFEMFARGQTWS